MYGSADTYFRPSPFMPSGRLKVAAATIAPVNSNVKSFSVMADRRTAQTESTSASAGEPKRARPTEFSPASKVLHLMHPGIPVGIGLPLFVSFGHGAQVKRLTASNKPCMKAEEISGSRFD
jgi:hypothetical protein